MKKVIKVILIIVAVVVIGVVALIAIAGYKGANYWKYTETSGDIEAKYTALGEHEVSTKEYDANDATIRHYKRGRNNVRRQTSRGSNRA